MLALRYLLHSVLNRTLCEDENVLEPALICPITAPLLGLLSVQATVVLRATCGYCHHHRRCWQPTSWGSAQIP